MIQSDSTAPTFVVIRGSETADDHKSSATEFPQLNMPVALAQTATTFQIQRQPPQQQFVLLQLPTVSANAILTTQAQSSLVQEKQLQQQQQQQQPSIPTMLHFARITNGENSIKANFENSIQQLSQVPQQRRSFGTLLQQPQQRSFGTLLQPQEQQQHDQQQADYTNNSTLRPMQGPIVKKIGGSKRFTSIR